MSAYRPWWMSHRGDSGIRARSATASDRGDGSDAQDHPPVRALGRVRGEHEDQQRDQVGHQDADGDHPLLDDRQLPAASLRGELRDVGGGDRGVRAHRQPDQGAGGDQHRRVDGEGGQQRADRVDRRVGHQQRLAAEAVRQGTGAQRPDRGAQRGPGDEVPGPERGELVRNEVQHRPDHRRVVAEEEPSDAGEKGEIPIERPHGRGVQTVQDALAATCVADCLWHAYLQVSSPGMCEERRTR